MWVARCCPNQRAQAGHVAKRRVVPVAATAFLLTASTFFGVPRYADQTSFYFLGEHPREFRTSFWPPAAQRLIDIRLLRLWQMRQC